MRSTEARTDRFSERLERSVDNSNEIQVFRLGDYGLIDVAEAPSGYEPVRCALLWEWSSSPAGVVIRVDGDEAPAEWVVQALTADAAVLVRTWPGTPIGLITRHRRVGELVVSHPQGHHVVVGRTLDEIWGGLWSRGGKANVTVELAPTGQAPDTACDVAVRACAGWGLGHVAGPAAQLTSDLVRRSVVAGAQDLHFTVSRHGSRVRVLARDDVPASDTEQRPSIDGVRSVASSAPDPAGHVDSVREFALDAHHVRWAVVGGPTDFAGAD